MTETGMEMPKYKCHKQVWALQIASVVFDADDARRDGRETDGSAVLSFTDARYAPRRVPSKYVRNHEPKAGGYFVVYEDGYESFSPAAAFEGGYSLIVEHFGVGSLPLIGGMSGSGFTTSKE